MGATRNIDKGFQALCWVVVCLAADVVLCSSSLDRYVLIKGGTVVNHDGECLSDVLVHGEKVAAVGPDLEVPEGAQNVKVINATGAYVMPGGIDPHTHLDMPFMGTTTCDDFYSGQAAALAGGTTMHIDFALPVDHDLWAGWELWKHKAQASVMDYSFHMAVTRWNNKGVGLSHHIYTHVQTWEDMGKLVEEGINSFKFFMAYKGALQVSDEELLEGMARCRELGALPMVHAENGDAVAWGQRHVMEVLGVSGPEGHGMSRPAVVEGEATGRAIRLARLVGVPLYVVHVMSEDAMREVAAAHALGDRVIGEPVVSGLALDDSRTWHANFSLAAQYVMSPPIRGQRHREALRKALAGGVLSHVATDHASFTSTQKAGGRHDFRLIPNGVHGLEERLHVTWQEMVAPGLMTPSDFVRATSTGAARAFNMYPRKGRVAAGSDADVIVFDPRVEHVLSAATHHHNNDLNIYEGYKVRGKVTVTISRGRVVWENGQLNVEKGSGRYVPLPVHGPLFDGLEEREQRARRVEFPYGPVPVDRRSCAGEDQCEGMHAPFGVHGSWA